MKALSFAALCFICLSLHAAEEFELSGNSWKERCDLSNPYYQAQCVDSIMGVTRGLLYGVSYAYFQYAQAAREEKKKRPLDAEERGQLMREAAGILPFCLGPKVTVGQIKDVVLAYIEARPEVRDRGLEYLAMPALVRAFPC